MTPADDVKRANSERLAQYILGLESHFAAYNGINPFWREITDTFRLQFVPPADTQMAGLNVDGIIGQIDVMPKTGYLVQPLPHEDCAAAWRQIRADLANPRTLTQDKTRYETAIVAHFLSDRGLLDEAEEMFNALGLQPKYVTLRHFFYFTQLRDVLSRHPQSPLDVLEIGAGGGTLKLLLKNSFAERIRSYSIVDLPEMLCLSAKATIEFFPAEPIHFIADAREPIDLFRRNIFIAADLADAIPRKPAFNLFLNTHSFQEMDPGIIASYFDLIYQTALPDAVFFQTNLLQKKMTRLNGSRFTNNPVKYPFRRSDDIVFAGEDPFHAYARERFDYKPFTRSLTTIRTINRHGPDRPRQQSIWATLIERVRGR